MFEITGIESLEPTHYPPNSANTSLCSSLSDTSFDYSDITPCSLSLPEDSPSLTSSSSCHSSLSLEQPSSTAGDLSPEFLSLPLEEPLQMDLTTEFPLMYPAMSPSLDYPSSGYYGDEESYSAGDCSSLIFHISGLSCDHSTISRATLEPLAASTPMKQRPWYWPLKSLTKIGQVIKCHLDHIYVYISMAGQCISTKVTVVLCSTINIL